ncbi:hypothetical protein [Teredinibacter purpureus]|uniref:hypothetical protein n=1 Tax=Teredinibacter purpureus TaxID=2731756 RepID=UPI0005F7783C|nr:hypothetical protein [Teredinibacter purpureus]
MIEYFGWLSTSYLIDESEMLASIKSIQGEFPASVSYVEGMSHISFSANPINGEVVLNNLVVFISGLEVKFSGCIYINNPNLNQYEYFEVIKIVEDRATRIQDRNFTKQEAMSIFGVNT